MEDALFKICIFGDGGVGKTTLVNKYLTGLFKGDTSMTIGIDFHIKKIELNGNKIALQIWDFAGEERFRFLLPAYLKGVSGGIFMYDITRYFSIKNFDNWLDVVNKDRKADELFPMLLVGGKADLKEKRVVESNQGFETLKKFNLDGFIECSAKTGENVENIFITLTRIMMEKAGLLEPEKNINPSEINS